MLMMMVVQSLTVVQSIVISQEIVLKTMVVQYTMVMENSLPLIVLSIIILLTAEEQPLVLMSLTAFSPIALQLVMVVQYIMVMLRTVLS